MKTEKEDSIDNKINRWGTLGFIAFYLWCYSDRLMQGIEHALRDIIN